MAKYTKKAAMVEAAQWDGNLNSIKAMFLPGEVIKTNKAGDILLLDTIEDGEMEVQIGDWIIKDTLGEYDYCEPDEFEKTYEKVE